ncbi:MAG TPA: AsmA-like C-terminal region-containing protein, partial [Cyclobacteriaceae bacterium]|nr:AsmA-like C-terminal region-containing protein [Cyclobacteriaceae bacterium]
MKIIRKILIGLSVVLAFLVVSAMILPILFKDKIKAKIDEELARTINADVVFDVNNFSLSVFRNFPNVTAEVRELGVFNRAPFEGVHLFVVDRFDVEINLKDVLFGDQLRVKGITIVHPQINVKVLKDGRANYNITYPSKNDVISKEPGKFSFAIDYWFVENAELAYDDAAQLFFLSLKGLDHSGSGNFNDKAFDLTTKTAADSVSIGHAGTAYLSNKRVEMNATIGISEGYTRYEFRRNSAKVNDFAIGFDGWFKVNEKDFGMDINFKSPENSFKSLLSLVPGMYSKVFSQIEANGDLSFAGFVKGTYSNKQMPAFNLDLKVKDAMFKYPSLPTAVSNINIDLIVDNATGVIENTLVDLKKFHLDLGSNPVDVRARIENLKDFPTDANVKAKLNLGEMSKVFPMEGMTLAGEVKADVSAKGVYDKAKKIIPANGSASLKDFRFISKLWPYALGIDQAGLSFNPQKIELKNISGTIGRSDFGVNGFVANYLEYIFGKGTITGTMNFNSTLLDLNEFMTNGTPTDKKDTSKLSVIPVPSNIDFILHADLKTIKMMDYVITQAAGDVIVKNAVADLNQVKLNMLGGAFVISGTYDTKEPHHPKYNFGLKVDHLSIQQAASQFSIIKTYAPIAGLATGKFGADFKINGELRQDMTPKLNTVNGDGLIKIAEAAITQSKLISGITSLTKLEDADNVTIRNVVMAASINDGKLNVKPFNVKIGNYVTSVSGYTALDGAIDYALKMNVPAGKLGSQFQALLSQYGGSKNPSSEIPLNIGLGGTFTNPKASLISQEQKQQVEKAMTDAIKEKGKEALQQAVKGMAAQ